MTRTILLGVTSPASLGLMRGFPEYLADHGWDVHVVSSMGIVPERFSPHQQFTHHTIPMARNPHPVKDFVALLRWWVLLMKLRPSVVDVGTPKAGLLGIVAAFFARVPHRVYLLRGLRYETSTGVKRFILKSLEKITISLSHHVIAVSPSLRELVISEGLVRRNKVTVLGAGSSNGVGLNRFYPDPEHSTQLRAHRWPADPNTPVFGFIGRIHPDKGVDLLYEAALLLHKDNLSFRLLIVGPNEHGVDYPKLFHQAGLPATFTGGVTDPLPLLRQMDVLCLPTKREGFPNVVLEAAACAIPTLATRATGVVDAIIDGDTGVLCSRRDPVEYAALMRALMSDPRYRQKLGHQARERVLKLYANEHVWERQHIFLTNLIHSNT